MVRGPQPLLPFCWPLALLWIVARSQQLVSLGLSVAACLSASCIVWGTRKEILQLKRLLAERIAHIPPIGRPPHQILIHLQGERVRFSPDDVLTPLSCELAR